MFRGAGEVSVRCKGDDDVSGRLGHDGNETVQDAVD